MNRTRRCCPVVVDVLGSTTGCQRVGPYSSASCTTPDEHAASPHSSTYTGSSTPRVEKEVNVTVGLTPLMIHQQSSPRE